MSAAPDLVIGVLLPDMLGTYSDAGNAVVLAQRARWRGINAGILRITADTSPPAGCNIYLLGGGEDTAQLYAIEWLARHRALRHALSETAVTFAVCAGLQILGSTLTDMHGRCHAGLGLLDLTTAPRKRRAVGEVITRSALPQIGLLTGFENHRGATALGAGVSPLGEVLLGVGNGAAQQGRRPGRKSSSAGPSSSRAIEGAVTDRVVATYLHGPVLARNPALADHILSRVVGREFPDSHPPDVPDLQDLRRGYLSPTPQRRARFRTLLRTR
ncbi:glutamine amidotransferase [Pseudonocardia aurantiaca]|uniref:Lipid II isoglutaminyl synthase (glutamine-hydrolyzing) subunit GatD n=1 Tax=Pseudonocardia aurantiaca TaxID=75290 RepID=A0ABW4FJM5_9PSEU